MTGSPYPVAEDPLPPACAKVCNDCPWRREAVPGWLGPQTAEEWIATALSDEPIACHQTITADEGGHGDWYDGRMRQCLGAATFRRNVGKLPRSRAIARSAEPDRERIFATPREFLDHHYGGNR